MIFSDNLHIDTYLLPIRYIFWKSVRDLVDQSGYRMFWIIFTS